MLRVKICGITNLQDAQLCDNLGFSAIGFVFYDKSKRYISPDEARNISSQLSPFLLKAGVFVNESLENIIQISSFVGLNCVQLHGDETHEFCSKLPLPVIKAFRINENFNFSNLSKFKNCRFLFDAYEENNYGGSGKKFNWELIPEEFRNDCVLAGGLNKELIKQAFRDYNFANFDLSSSVEKYPGKKDERKLRELKEVLNKLIEGEKR